MTVGQKLGQYVACLVCGMPITEYGFKTCWDGGELVGHFCWRCAAQPWRNLAAGLKATMEEDRVLWWAGYYRKET